MRKPPPGVVSRSLRAASQHSLLGDFPAFTAFWDDPGIDLAGVGVRESFAPFVTKEVLMRRRRYVAIGVSALVALAVAGVAVGVATRGSGQAITAVRAVEETAQTNTNSTTFVNLPEAVTTPITVPTGQTALMLVHFSAESQCDGGTTNTICSVRIILLPATGGSLETLPLSTDFAFDQDIATDDLNGAASMTRWRVVGSGQWRAQVQFRVSGAATTFSLDDWSLILQRADRS
jgi:hypothetical protein